MRVYKDIDPDDFKTRLLGWIESLRVKEGSYGVYRGSSEGSVPTGLYPSFYAAITRYFYRDLEAIGQAEKEEWIDYLASYQDAENGWFDDRSIRFFSSGERGIKEFLHETSFAVSALECLGAKPPFPLGFVENLTRSLDGYRNWLDSLEWQVNPWMASVWLMFSFFLSLRNLTARGLEESSMEHRSLVDTIFGWLSKHQDPATGLWGTEKGASLYQGFGAALHHWILYDAFDKPLSCSKVNRQHVVNAEEGWSFRHGPGSDGLRSCLCALLLFKENRLQKERHHGRHRAAARCSIQHME